MRSNPHYDHEPPEPLQLRVRNISPPAGVGAESLCPTEYDSSLGRRRVRTVSAAASSMKDHLNPPRGRPARTSEAARSQQAIFRRKSPSARVMYKRHENCLPATPLDSVRNDSPKPAAFRQCHSLGGIAMEASGGRPGAARRRHKSDPA